MIFRLVLSRISMFFRVSLDVSNSLPNNSLIGQTKNGPKVTCDTTSVNYRQLSHLCFSTDTFAAMTDGRRSNGYVQLGRDVCIIKQTSKEENDTEKPGLIAT